MTSPYLEQALASIAASTQTPAGQPLQGGFASSLAQALQKAQAQKAAAGQYGAQGGYSDPLAQGQTAYGDYPGGVAPGMAGPDGNVQRQGLFDGNGGMFNLSGLRRLFGG